MFCKCAARTPNCEGNAITTAHKKMSQEFGATFWFALFKHTPRVYEKLPIRSNLFSVNPDFKWMVSFSVTISMRSFLKKSRTLKPPRHQRFLLPPIVDWRWQGGCTFFNSMLLFYCEVVRIREDMETTHALIGIL